MDVVLSEEEQMVLSAAREFFEAEASPRLARAMEKEEPGYSTDLWSKLAELGWTGVSIPERYGGQGLPLVYLGLVLQEAGRAIAPVPLLSTAIAALTIAEAGSEELQQEILPRVSTGDVVLSFAFQEEDPRLFVPDTIQMHAEQNGDEYVLSGTKMFVDNFSIADYCLVPCRTLEPSGVREGISLFLVDTTSPGIVDTPLVTLAKDKQSRVSFDRVRVPREHVVGPIDGGWPVIQQALDRAVPLLCAQMLGAARKDAELAIDYATQRVAFGRPVGAFQSVQHIAADMIIWLDGGDLLTYEALWLLDHGLPVSVEVSQAKSFCNDKCQAVVRYGQMIHGGIGFMEEFDIHLWYRRVAAWTMRLGTSFEHRHRIARALLAHEGRVRLDEPLVAVS